MYATLYTLSWCNVSLSHPRYFGDKEEVQTTEIKGYRRVAGLSYLLLVKTLPKLRRCDITDGGVSALPVVIDLNIFKNSGLCLRSGRIMLVTTISSLFVLKKDSAQALS